MIEKVHGFKMSNLSFASSDKPLPAKQTEGADTFDKKSNDVKYNFTFKVNDNNAGSLHLFNGKSKISGKSYGLDYVIERKGNRSLMELTGKIGDKPLYIKYKSRGWFSPYTDIEGFVGEKKVKLTERSLFACRNLRGTFGNEEIKLSYQSMYHGAIIQGKGIDISLINYISQPTHRAKYVGEYYLDPEFLPVLAGLYRYQ